MITLIVASSENNVIGNKGKIPWYLPRDLKHFKETTLGHTVVMGRKTHDSIGKPLSERKNIVLTRQNVQIDGCVIAHSIEEVLEKSKENSIFIIGGEEIYKQFLPHAEKIILTKVHTNVDGDAYFPEINNSKWKLTNSEDFQKDEENNFDITIETYERK